MLYRQYSYAALLVQLCCTIGAGMLPLLVHLRCHFGIPMLNQQFSYAEPTVFLCWTFGTRMLYSSGTVFLFNLQPVFFPILLLNPSTSSINNHVDNPVEKCVDNIYVIHSKNGRQWGQVDINTLINRYWRKFPRFFIHKRYKLIIFAPNVGIVDKSC